MRHLRIVTSQKPYGGNIIAKMADCGSDVVYLKMINISRTTKADVNYDFVTSFWRTKAIVTSHFTVGTLTDLLAKARLLDRDVNLMCQFNCIMAAFIKKSPERCVLLKYGLIR